MVDGALIGAGLAIGLAGLGVTIGEGLVASNSIEAFGKNPELGQTLRKFTILGVALVESAAIYGLIVALLITFGSDVSVSVGIGAGIAIGLPGLATGIGEGLVASNAIAAIARNPAAEKDIMSNMILYIALVESCAIYGLITALLILFS